MKTLFRLCGQIADKSLRLTMPPWPAERDRGFVRFSSLLSVLQDKFSGFFRLRNEEMSNAGFRKLTGLGNRVLIAGLSIFLIYGTTFAETTKEIYLRKKDNIIKLGIYEKGGYVFSCGKTGMLKRTASARERAWGVSRTKALIGFYRRLRLGIRWPEYINEKIHGPLFEQYVDLSGIKLKVSKAETVDTGLINDETCYTVLAIPKENIQYDLLSYSQIISVLNNAFENTDSRLNHSLYLDICSEGKIGQVIPRLADKLGAKYGANVSSVVKGEFFSQPPDFSVIEKIASLETIEGLDYDGLFGLLNLCPYFPKACYLLGKKMREQGKSRSASLFFQRGTVWKIDDEFNELCKKSLTETWPNFRLPKSHRELLNLKSKIVVLYESSHLSLGPNSEAVIKSLGTIPIKDAALYSSEFDKGNDFFYSSPPDINKALEHYLAELEQNMSGDVCNMIGCCFRIKKQYYLAIPYLLQATLSNPQHKYAWVNLALIFNEIGMKNEAEEYAKIAERSANIDTWGKDQLKLILQDKMD